MIDPTIPLIDLHRHLDGSVRLETILDLGKLHNLPLPSWDLDGLRPHVQVMERTSGVMEFIDKFKWMVGVLVDYDACRRVAFENVEDAFQEGLDYLELRFSPWFMSEPHRLDPAGVTFAVVEGVKEGKNNFDVQVNLIGIISRTYGPEIGWLELDALLTQRENISALDLAGDEVNCPGELFVDHMKRGRDAGWEITVHAGESSGPDSVWQAIKDLGATRIGHATRSAEDLRLLDYLASNRIGIEVNLTSNVQTAIVPDYASHPMRSFLEYGLIATINTDDPGISGIDLRHEYEVAAPAAGLTPELIHLAQRNALEVAFITAEEKQILLARKKKPF